MKKLLFAAILLTFFSCGKEDVTPITADHRIDLTVDINKFNLPVIDLYEEWINPTGGIIQYQYKKCDQSAQSSPKILFYYADYYEYSKVGAHPLFIYNRGNITNVRVQDYCPSEITPYFSAFIYRIQGSGTYYRMIIRSDNPINFIYSGVKFSIETRSGLITHTGQTTFLPLIN